MKRSSAIWFVVLTWPALVTAVRAQANGPATETAKQPAASSYADTEKGIQQDIELLRSDVRQRKSEVMAEMMQLSAADATKFWPIYKDYDAELNKLGDLRVANIEDYANTYAQMTNDKADELAQKMLAYRKQRSELLAKYYERVKERLGAITAARFVQVEDQLLLIIDLQIDSQLPIIGQNS